MFVIRIIAFFIVVIISSCYTTYMLSANFLYDSLETKDQMIAMQNAKIDELIKQNEHQNLVIGNLRDVLKDGVKTGCLKNKDVYN